MAFVRPSLSLYVLTLVMVCQTGAASTIELPDLIESAKKNSPKLTQAVAEARAAAALSRQEAAFPNPTLELQGGSKEAPDSRSEILAGTITQAVPMWGQRAGRSRIAKLAEKVAELRVLAAEASLVGDVLAFAAENASARSQWAGLSERQALLQPVHSFLSSQAFASPQQKADQAVVEGRLRELEGEKADLRAEVSASTDRLLDLSGMKAGSGDLDFSIPTDLRYPIPKLPGLETMLKNNPAVNAVRLEESQAEEERSLAAHKGLPNPELSLGYERERIVDTEQTLLAGIAFPLPLFDRNRHGLEAAVQAQTLTVAKGKASQKDLTLRRLALARRLEALEILSKVYSPSALRRLEAQLHGSERDFKKGRLPLLSYLEVEEETARSRERSLSINLEIVKIMAEFNTMEGKTSIPAAWPIRKGDSHAQ